MCRERRPCLYAWHRACARNAALDETETDGLPPRGCRDMRAAVLYLAAIIVVCTLPHAVGAQEVPVPLNARFPSVEVAAIGRPSPIAMPATPWSEGSTMEVAADDDVSVGALLVFTPLATAAGEAAAVYMFTGCVHLWCQNDPTMTYGIALPISAAIAVASSTVGARSAGADSRRACLHIQSRFWGISSSRSARLQPPVRPRRQRRAHGWATFASAMSSRTVGGSRILPAGSSSPCRNVVQQPVQGWPWSAPQFFECASHHV